MKRTTIRILGTCMAVFGAIGMRDAKSDYTHTAGYTVLSYTANGGTGGYLYVFNDAALQGSYCNQFKDGNNKYTCATGTATEALCRWCSCWDGKQTPCGTYSSCDGTGLKCEKDMLAGASSMVLNKTSGQIGSLSIFKFSGCLNGAYQTKSTSPCDAINSGTDLNAFTGCCILCPGRGRFNEGLAAFPTGIYAGNADNMCVSGYCFGSTAGTGITNCYVYESGATSSSGQTYNDCVGKYMLANRHCSYSSTLAITENDTGCATTGTGSGTGA